MEEEQELERLEAEAKKGGAEAQLCLGSHYLSLAETDAPEGQNAKYGVDWLVKAARQGNEAATEKLRDCLQKQLGVDESNLGEVRWCITTPQYERLAREAARKLFRKLHPFGASTGAGIGQADFLKGLEGLATNKAEQKLLQKAGKMAAGGGEITEEMFVGKMLRRLQGQGGITLTSLLQNDVEWEAYNNAPFIHKLTKYPGKTLAWIADNTIETAGSQGRVWLRSLIPVNQLYMLVVLFLYSLVSLDAVLWVVPLGAFYAAYAAMLISTMQMFYSRRKLNDVRALAGMLERFNDQFVQESAESAYQWNSLSPYVSFFLALPAMLLSFSAADKTWIPCSELVTVSLLITVACFFALSDSYDHLAILSIFLDNVSTLPAVIDSLPRVPVLHRLLEATLGAGLALELLPNFYVQLGIPSLAYVIVPLLFLRMATKRSWSGTYQILVPHLVCFLWWRVVVLFYVQSTWWGLLRGSVGWALLIVLMPVLTVGFFAWLAYVFARAFSIASVVKIATTVSLLGVIAAIAVWSRGGFKIGGRFSLEQKSMKVNVLLSVFLLVSSVPLVYIVAPEDLERRTEYLSFDAYRDACGLPAWARGSVGDASVACVHFSEAKVNWTGIVKQVTVKRIENQAEAFIDYLPRFASDWLQCVYGDEYPEDCGVGGLEGRGVDESERAACEFNKLRGRTCHLKNLNRYTFEIAVLVEGFEVRLIASHFFRDIAPRLHPGSTLLFRAYLAENLGGVFPVLRLYSLRCESCNDAEMVYGGSLFGHAGWTALGQLRDGLQAVWNFFLAPVLLFK